MNSTPCTSFENLSTMEILKIILIFLFLYYAYFHAWSPKVTPYSDTLHRMHTVQSVLWIKSKNAGHDNLYDFINNFSEETRSKYTIESDIMRLIVKNEDIVSDKYYKDGVFFDAWGKPIIVKISANNTNDECLVIHSWGPNMTDDKCEKDDLVLIFNKDWSLKLKPDQAQTQK